VYEPCNLWQIPDYPITLFGFGRGRGGVAVDEREHHQHNGPKSIEGISATLFLLFNLILYPLSVAEIATLKIFQGDNPISTLVSEAILS